MRTALLAAAGVLLATSAATQGLVPHVGPDGRVYWRRAPIQAVQQYVTPDIVAPERPRGAPRPRGLAPPVDIVPLDRLPLAPTPTAPAPTAPVQSEPDPLIEWCKQEANARAPLCRNVGSPRVQR